MPFWALRDGEVVVPTMVESQEPVTCPECQRTMYVRDGPDRARHFVHVDDSAGASCPGPGEGESATHRRCVALAVAALHETFGSQASRCAPEVDLDVSMSGSGNQTRRADALVEFDSVNQYFGLGLVVEVQHRHHDKEVQMTTHDYLSAGYSVVWLSSDVFGDEQLDYSVVETAFSSPDGQGYSVREHPPERFLSCQSYHYSEEHNWGTVPSYVLTVEEDYEVCVSPGCPLRRQFDEERGEYDYDSESITLPDLPLRVLRNTVVRKQPASEVEDWLRERYGNSVLEKALADRPEIGPCSGPKGFHEWKSPKTIKKSHVGYPKTELRACQHCPVHLLTDFTGYDQDWKYIFLSKHPDPEWDLTSLEADPRQCDHWCHEGGWYEFCPDCGVTNP